MANGHIDEQIIEFRRRIDNFYGIDYRLGSDFATWISRILLSFSKFF